MNIIEREVDKLIPYSKNAKKHDETQISNVAESIKQFGFVQPVVVDKNGVIVIGHCRTLAAKKLGMKTVLYNREFKGIADARALQEAVRRIKDNVFAFKQKIDPKFDPYEFTYNNQIFPTASSIVSSL